MATPTESAVFDGYRLATLNRSLRSLRDQVKTLDASENAQEELEESVGILRRWLTVHFKYYMDPESTAPNIWGAQGWKRMQNLLFELSSKIDTIHTELQPIFKAEERAEETEHKSAHILDLLPLFVELHEFLEMFANFSEIRCRMNHPELSPGRPALGNALQARRGAYIFYDAIQTEGIRCDLKIDLFSSDSASETKLQEPPLDSNLHQRVCYHLVFKDYNRNDLRFQDVTCRKDMSNTASIKTHEDATCLFGPLEPNSVRTHCIQRGLSDPQTYFHVSNGVDHTLAIIPLSDYLKTPPPGIKKSDWMHSKFLLAFQLSECALNLMGTPFLAHLSVEDIFVRTSKINTVFTLAVPTLSVEELHRQDPHLLTESKQLLDLGLLMMHIALGPLEDYKTLASPQDKYAYAAELLPCLYEETSDAFHKICAFCVEEWILKDEQSKPDTWDRANECEQNVWLQDFLRVYDSIVVEGYVTEGSNCSFPMHAHI
ncbi:MAG: hypothetical protein OHK93_002670 [Ramalina farinacea]|uniref:Uncharacterized protein n=1 Tax=Ramalina farinacea TaxID=258253 RepID=A0AA43TTZ6_9LECA|nr:hypothetical protein [Ramalina farinacea]